MASLWLKSVWHTKKNHIHILTDGITKGILLPSPTSIVNVLGNKPFGEVLQLLVSSSLLEIG